MRKYSDEWVSASNKIGAALGDASKGGGGAGLVADIAERSRSAFAETADLYARLSRASKALGATQGEVAVATETVSKALSLSGASAQEAAADDQVRASAEGAAPAVRSAGDAAAASKQIAEATRIKEGENLKVFCEDAMNFTTTLRTLILDMDRFGALNVSAADKARALELLKAALDGDAKAAFDARTTLLELGQANPSFSAAFGAFDVLLTKLAAVRQAAVNAQAAVTAAATETRIVELLKGVDLRGENARNSGLLQRQATNSFSAEQERLSQLTDEQKKIEAKTRELQEGAAKAGGYLDPLAAKALAGRLVKNEDAAGDTGSRSDNADAIKSQVEALQQERREIEAEVGALGKGNAERRIATELAKNNANATSAAGQAIRSNVTAIEAGEAALKKYDAAQKQAGERAKFFGTTAVDALGDLLFSGASLADTFHHVAEAIGRAALQAALLGTGPLAGLFGSSAGSGLLSGLFGAPAKLADGGFVSGPGSSRSDSIPARLSDGEFVVRADATARHRGLLEAVNSGSHAPAFARGGLVGGSSTRALARGGDTHVNMDLKVAVNAMGGRPEDNQDLAERIGRQLKTEMKGMVQQEIYNARRPGGQLY